MWLHVVPRGNSNLDFALRITIITQATIMDKQNNGLALIFAYTYTIICPTTVKTEMSMWKTNRIARTYKHFATNQGKSDLDGVTTS